MISRRSMLAAWLAWLLAISMAPSCAALPFSMTSKAGPASNAVVEQSLYMYSSYMLQALAKLQERRRGAPLHIAYVGDSTVRQQQRVLCTALTEPVSADAFSVNSLMNDAMPAVDTCSHAHLNVSVTYVQAGCTVGTLAEGAERLAALGAQDVVVFNYGLHMLHLLPARTFWCVPQTLHYEEQLQAGMEALQNVSSVYSGATPSMGGRGGCDCKYGCAAARASALECLSLSLCMDYANCTIAFRHLHAAAGPPPIHTITPLRPPPWFNHAACTGAQARRTAAVCGSTLN